MLREFFLQGAPTRLLGAWFGIAAFLGHAGFRAYLKWALNNWYRVFYDAIGSGVQQSIYDNHDAHGSGEAGSGDLFGIHALAAERAHVSQLLVEFAWLVAPAVVVHPVSKWIASMWRFAWRVALVEAYLQRYDVTLPAIEGAAQRIHEDTQRFENGIYTCFTVVLDSLLTLGVFIPVLIDVGGRAMPPGIDWPPWLVCIAVSAALGGLGISMAVGHRLVSLEVANQMVEGQLRTKLVQLQETPHVVVGRLPNIMTTEELNAAIQSCTAMQDTYQIHDAGTLAIPGAGVGIALNGHGAPPLSPQPLPIPAPKPRPVAPKVYFDAVLGDLWSNYRRLFANFAAFNLWITTFDQTLVVLPYVLVAPLIFAEDPARRISLGTLTQVSNAFSQVFSALSVVSENWTAVNDFRSTLVRLREFEGTLYARGRTAATSYATVVEVVELSDVAEVSPVAEPL